MVLLWAAAATPLAAQEARACSAGPRAPRLDHVVIAVRSLDSAGRDLARAGFRLKPGHRHPDNLENRHVKFGDGSALELMSLTGPPGDRMAARYRDLLAEAEGGAYVALTGTPLDRADAAAGRAGLLTERSASGNWQFLGFPRNSEAASLFFLTGPSARDPDSLLQHENGATGVAEAWIEAGPAVRHLLASLGASACGAATLPDGRIGERWLLARGSLVLVPLRPGQQQPRVVAVRLEAPGPVEPIRLRGFWITFGPTLEPAP